MEEWNRQDDVLLIFGEYPHSLMQHILVVLRERKKGKDWLLSEEFFSVFISRYSDFRQEILELKTAKRKDILKGFIENTKERDWRKRVFIQMALSSLLEELREYQAVELLESLMWVFGWNFSVEIEREWETEEGDKAAFHDFSKSVFYQTGNQTFDSVMKQYVSERNEVERFGEESGESSENEMIQDREHLIVPESCVKEPEKGKHRPESDRTFRKEQEAETKKNGKYKDSIEELLDISKISEEEYLCLLKETPVKFKRFMSHQVLKEVKKAKCGNDFSQVAVAGFYAEEGTGHTDYFEAARWYSFAVRKGNDKAKLELGRIFDSEKLLAEGENSRMVGNRVDALRTKRYGIAYFAELAEKGYPTAQCILGMKYYFGDGVEKNTAKGVRWLKKAAKQGYREAQMQLGEIYMNLDEEKAKRWFVMAEENRKNIKLFRK